MSGCEAAHVRQRWCRAAALLLHNDRRRVERGYLFRAVRSLDGVFLSTLLRRRGPLPFLMCRISLLVHWYTARGTVGAGIDFGRYEGICTSSED